MPSSDRWIRFLMGCWTWLTTQSPVLEAGDWPQWLGPQRNGVANETGLVTSFPEKGPSIVWKREVGAGFAGVVVAEGTGILFHRVGDEEIVESFEARTGKVHWKFAYRTRYVDDFGFDEGPRATPLIADGKVFTLGADGELTALEWTTGKKLWQRNINADYQVRKGYFGTACSPLWADGKVLINVGGRRPNSGVVAFDPLKGKELWKSTDHEASYSSPTLAVIAGRPCAVFLTRAGLLGLDPATGKVRFEKPWRARIQASVNAATPLVHGEEIFVSASYNTGGLLVRVAADDALTEIWSGDDILSNHYNTSVRVGEFLFGVDGRQEAGASLRCVEWKTGKIRWSKDRFGCAALIVADGAIWAQSEMGQLIRFEPTAEGYRETARATLVDKPCRAMPALADGLWFVRDSKKLIAVDLNLKR